MSSCPLPRPQYRLLRPTVTDLLRPQYQLLHETGRARLPVARPPKPTPAVPKGTCGKPVEGEDVWGGDACSSVQPCSTCGLFTMEDCCNLCLRCANCDTAELWTSGSDRTHGYRCAMKVRLVLPLVLRWCCCWRCQSWCC